MLFRLARLAISVILLSLVVLAQPAAASDDELGKGQWYTKYLRLDVAHRFTKGSGVVVAIIDTGVDANHPALSGRVMRGADFSSGDGRNTGDGQIDSDGHGTGMAGLIVGHGRIAGVAPEARILPVRVMRTAGSGSTVEVAAGIDWAADHGADIINVSLASAVRDPRELAAVNRALSKGVLVVAGVGNRPDMATIQYPAAYPGVVAVGSIDRSGSHSQTSVTGPELVVSAPGEAISIASARNGFALATGTSVASAVVAGIAALLISQDRNLGLSNLVRKLTESAADAGAPGRDEVYGYGIVDAVTALMRDVGAESGTTHKTSNLADLPGSTPGAMPAAPLLVTASILVLLLALISGAIVWRRAQRPKT